MPNGSGVLRCACGTVGRLGLRPLLLADPPPATTTAPVTEPFHTRGVEPVESAADSPRMTAHLCGDLARNYGDVAAVDLGEASAVDYRDAASLKRRRPWGWSGIEGHLAAVRTSPAYLPRSADDDLRWAVESLQAGPPWYTGARLWAGRLLSSTGQRA
jgi:hypothetical protein